MLLAIISLPNYGHLPSISYIYTGVFLFSLYFTFFSPFLSCSRLTFFALLFLAACFPFLSCFLYTYIYNKFCIFLPQLTFPFIPLPPLPNPNFSFSSFSSLFYFPFPPFSSFPYLSFPSILIPSLSTPAFSFSSLSILSSSCSFLPFTPLSLPSLRCHVFP